MGEEKDGLEETFVMIKPDGVQRRLIGDIIQRFEQKGLKIKGLKMYLMGTKEAEVHYAEHKDKSFFKDLVSFITSGPNVSMVIEGKDAVSVVRSMVGKTDPKDAAPGTIRGDYGMDLGRNVIHASDSTESAEREIKQHFSNREITDYRRIDEDWLYE
ncbi:MAG TPA: nucleoside-diphosphate kinase [Halobacteria archaeon]|jgi:nucleoside-diphosphate kinase|nr:nucleoside-diphosphate kinase [Halobacteria archaeon]HIH78467.1 nucleoside-diphosphate kinase [Halobacteria archaeon]